MLLFDDKLRIDYGQAYVACSELEVDEEYEADPFGSAFRNQSNGLCGAANRGMLTLIFGAASGYVNFRIVLVESKPPIDDTWQDIVEVPFEVVSPEVNLVDWLGNFNSLKMPLGNYRARYHCNNMDEGHAAEEIGENEDCIESYLLIFWPSPAEPDTIIKQTSESAAYLHKCAQNKSL